MQSSASDPVDVCCADLVVDDFGVWECCECLRATWQELLEHFPNTY
jgi:hypothetical protein